MLGVYEFLPNLDLFKLIGQQLCRDTSPFIAICENVLFLIVGFNERNLNAVSRVVYVHIKKLIEFGRKLFQFR